MSKPKRFTRIPLPEEFAGVPREAISTYTTLASYANNDTGLCHPRMDTLAKTLNYSARTIQRHLRALREAGLVEFVERRRYRGRFSSYLYRLVHYARFARAKKGVSSKPETTGHTRPSKSKRSIKSYEHKPLMNSNREENLEKQRLADAARRKEGMEWAYGDDKARQGTIERRKWEAERRSSQMSSVFGINLLD